MLTCLWPAEYTAALERAYLPVVEDLRECYKQLSGLVPPTLYHKYRDHWRTHVQRQVQAMALLHFLQTNALVPHADAQQAVCGGYLALELDDYLCGVASLPADLANLSVALAIRGAYAFVVQAHAFVVELHAAFQQLNLKNDALRRRFDGIKYDVKRLEQMVYDLRIRSLVPPPPAAHAK